MAAQRARRVRTGVRPKAVREKARHAIVRVEVAHPNPVTCFQFRELILREYFTGVTQIRRAPSAGSDRHDVGLRHARLWLAEAQLKGGC